jgi:hypothetical protein
VIVKYALLIAIALSAACCLATAQLVDKNKPYARVCLAVMNSASGDEEALRVTSAPGKGKKIVAHIEASAKCEAVIAAHNRKTGQLVPGWAPQFAEVAQWHEALLPKGPVTWNWANDAGPIEFHVLIFAPGSKESAGLRRLVDAMQGTPNEKMAHLQADKLRELIGRVEAGKVVAARGPKADATEVGGVFRMVVGFEWRDAARSANFTVDNPGALVFP